MSERSVSELRLGLLLALRRLAASISVDRGNPDRLGSDDAEAITIAAEKLTSAVQTLRLMPGGQEVAISILNAAEELAARAPLNETRLRAYAAPIRRRENSAAGKKSGEARASAAEATWHPHVLDLARGALATNPTLSTSRLADLVSSRWELAGGPPGERTLRGVISRMRKSGSLSERAPTSKLARNRLPVSKKRTDPS